MNASTETAVAAEPLIRKIQALMDEVEAVIARSQAPDRIEAGRRLEALQTRIAAAAQSLRAFCDSARGRVLRGAREADGAIRAHPYGALAVSLGVGVWVGVLLRRGD